MNDVKSRNRVLIIAAEASSALYAQRLLEHWSSVGRDIDGFGVGDVAMEEFGFNRLGQSEEMAVVGFKEVISHWNLISNVFKKIVSECESNPPEFALLLDYPGFNLRLAKKLKTLGIPVIYYISPQVWAWKKGRIKEIKKYVDKMLVLFPFEKKFYTDHKVNSEFVGHPLLDELDESLFDETKTLHLREKFGVQRGDLLIGLMPGSRNSELDYNLDRQVSVARKLYIENRGKQPLRFALFVAPTLSVESIKARLGDLDFPLMLVRDDPFQMIRMADLILTASGTATIFVGLLSKPLLIMYIMNRWTAKLAKFLVTSTKYFGMVNIILEKEVGKEFFQDQATVSNLALNLQTLIDSPEKRKQQIKELGRLRGLLGERGATKRVSRELEPYFKVVQ